MAEINQTVWGDEQYWIDISDQYSQSLDVKEKVQWASYDGTHNKVYDFLHEDLIEANAPIDNTLSWCGLGEHSPYNRLTYYCGTEAYSYRFNDNIPWTTFDDNNQEQVVVQQTNITNFAMGHNDQTDGFRHDIPILNRANNKWDRFHKFWGPDSIIDTLEPNPYSTVPYDSNRTLHTIYFARVPIKNIICVPKIIAINNIDTTNPSYISVDLETYLDTEDEENTENYVNYPYVISGQMEMYTDLQGSRIDSAIHNRNTSLGVNTVSMLKDLTMLNGAPANYSEDVVARYIDPNSVEFEGDGCICYELIYGDSLPIYGLLSGANMNTGFANCRHDQVDVPSENGTWDWKAVNYNHYEFNVNAPTIFTWAGEDPSIHVYNPTSREDCRRYIYKQVTAQNADDFRETIRQAIACFGLFFVDGIGSKNHSLDAEDVMLGILENGIGNGKYSHGEDNKLQDQWNWDDAHENDYDPSDPPTPYEPDYDFDSELEAANRELGVPGANIYISTLAQFQEVKNNAEDRYAEIIAEAEDGDFSEIASLAAAFGHTENPSDCYYNIICYPFKITDWISDLSETLSARLGKSDFTASSKFKWVGSGVKYGSIPCGQVLMKPGVDFGGENNWKCFLNYPPYTTASLYLPFCGTIEIDPCVYMNRYIGVKYLVDWRSGACQALIFRSSTKQSYGELMESISGTMGYRMNFSATDATSYCNSMVSLAARADDARRSLLETAAKGIKAALGSNNTASAITNTATGLYNVAEAKDNYDIARYELQAEPIPVKKISTATPAINTLSELSPRLDIYRPVSDYTSTGDNARYGSVIGNRCLIIGHRPTIHAYGYVVYDKIQLWSTTATEKEIGMIKSLLSSGVYVDQYVPEDQ